MRYSVPTKNVLLLSILGFLLCHVSAAQNLHLIPEVKSPNVSNFETFGNVPVNYFTGTPNISIPIYTLQSGNIQVPISLSYHPSNVKPATQPGWVGFGWSLNPGGSITRKMNGNIDELFQPEGGNYINPPYYPYPYPYNNVGSGSEKINNASNWNTEAALIDHFIYTNNTGLYDVQADEFNFSFLGYSGKFIYTGPGSNQGWKAISDQELKIELTEDEFFNTNQIYSMLGQYIPFANRAVPDGTTAQSRFFKGFIITTPDGTKYEFGGENAVELFSHYANSHSTYSIDTWLLKKIIDINNNVIEFKYKRTYPTCNLGFSAGSYSNAWSNSPAFNLQMTGAGFNLTSTNANQLYGNYRWSLYLEKIISSNIDVLFSSDVANCLVYTRPVGNDITSQLRTPREPNNLNSITDFDHINTDTDNIQWEQLNTIEIKDKSKIPSNQTRVLHEFTYSSNPNKRLTLEAYEKQGENDDSRKRYEFTYNDMSAYDGITCNGDFSDHWGFFNNKTAHNYLVTFTNMNNRRSVDVNYLLKGLLKEIKYPTSGKTVFEWERHDYSQVVSTNRDQLIPSVDIAGGVRIKEINSYSETSELLSKKKYYYKNNFVKGVNLSTLSSSGILNVIPQYAFIFTDRPNNLNNGEGGNAYQQMASFNSYTNYGYTGQGSHIGYSEVTEENMDGSYSIHYFTNYGTDKLGVSHFDKPPKGRAGFLPSVDTYMPHSSLELERGKEIGVFDYNYNNLLMKKSLTYYRNDPSRFTDEVDQLSGKKNFIRFIPWTLRIGLLGLIAGTAEYCYVYYPIKTETTTYDITGNNPIVSTTEYAYNGSNQISEQKTISSTGNELKTTYKYPSDFPKDPNNSMVAKYNDMTNINYILPVIESKQFEKIAPANPIQTNLTQTDYIKTNGMFLPNSVKRQKGVSDPLITDMQVLRNDEANGNILEYSIPNGTTSVLVWGHGNQYPIAKIENASYSNVAAALGITINALKKYNEQKMNGLNGLRGLLPEAMITTYTYDPLYGIRSMTDPGGRTTYYYYDDFGRLSYTRDNEGKILSYSEYHYKN